MNQHPNETASIGFDQRRVERSPTTLHNKSKNIQKKQLKKENRGVRVYRTFSYQQKMSILRSIQKALQSSRREFNNELDFGLLLKIVKGLNIQAYNKIFKSVLEKHVKLLKSIICFNYSIG